jgi:galactonate dehydratase
VLYPVDFETALVRVDLSNGMTWLAEAQAPLAPSWPGRLSNCCLLRCWRAVRWRAGELASSQLLNTMRVRGQTGGYQLDAMAGVDLALWDLAGQLAGQSVARMLGGGRRLVPAYVSGVAGATDEERLAFIGEHVERDFACSRFIWRSRGRSWSGVSGCSSGFFRVRFAVDALWHLPEGAGQDLDLEWMECPFPPEEIEAHARWAAGARAPLAVGESYRTRYELRPWLGLAGVLQPDLGRCGITESVAIGKLAKRLVPHVSIALAPQILAAVHLAAALPNSGLCEYNPRVLEVANRPLAEPIVLDWANYVVPERPGLGVVFHREGPGRSMDRLTVKVGGEGPVGGGRSGGRCRGSGGRSRSARCRSTSRLLSFFLVSDDAIGSG